MNKMPDIYFDRNYGRLYEKAENGRAELFEYENEQGKICHQFIRREIPMEIDGVRYYDLVTPYGYGGPVVLECDGSREMLIKGFGEEFFRYCRNNRIVSEFVRFHPLFDNGIDFKELYQSECIRQTVGTKLVEFDDPVQAEFSKGCRKRIRKGIRDGISYKVTECPKDLRIFQIIYYSTMERNQAGDYYYFDETYFSDCLKYFGKHCILVEAFLEEKVIAAGFYFVWNKTIHIHLSGTLSEYLFLSPAYILRYAVTLWGKENGYELIHHGGGRSDSPDDSLYSFKKQFGKQTGFDFYVGRKIWNQKIYEQLCEKRKKQPIADGYFPKYREE